jgi:hypothetical protein
LTDWLRAGDWGAGENAVTDNIIRDLAEIYAVEGLAGRREAVGRAVRRAVYTRMARPTPLQGAWQGVVEPHVDGHLNFIPGPIPSPSEPHVIRCGGNGGGISRDISLVPPSLRTGR